MTTEQPNPFSCKLELASSFAMLARSSYSITFQQDGKNIGVLDFSGPAMTFEGDAENSATVFFGWIATSFAMRLEDERKAERERCAKICEELGAAPDASSEGYEYGCAIAIRAVVDD